MNYTRFKYGIFNDAEKVKKLNNNDPQRSFLWESPIYSYDSPEEAIQMRDKINLQREFLNQIKTGGRVHIRRRTIRYMDWEDDEYTGHETLLHLQQGA